MHRHKFLAHSSSEVLPFATLAGFLSGEGVMRQMHLSQRSAILCLFSLRLRYTAVRLHTLLMFFKHKTLATG